MNADKRRWSGWILALWMGAKIRLGVLSIRLLNTIQNCICVHLRSSAASSFCVHLRPARLTALALFIAVTTASAQDPWFRGGGMGEGSGIPKFAKVSDYDGALQFCRLMYRRVRQHERGLGWSTDYPNAERNFSIRLSELTKTRVSRTKDQPNTFVVRATDEYLEQCPILMMSDPASAGFTEEEVQGLRTYLLKGGFLWADDFWGPWAWSDFTSEIGKVLPPSEYPIHELGPDHPIFRTMFVVKQVPQVPSIQFWWQTGGATSELGRDSAQAHMAAISDAHGRIMVLMSHNTDIADSWEREGADPQFFYNFSPEGYAIGMNVALYALSH